MTASTGAAIRMVQVGDEVELWAEQLGESGRETVLLLGGAGFQATAWEPAVTQAFLDAEFSVIRFDWRDVGRSTWRSFREHPYGADTLVNDAVAVLDAFEIAVPHVVGFSMGGIMAQLTALAHPDRVRSLTFMASGLASAGGNEFWTGERSAELFALQGQPRPTTTEEEIDRLLVTWRHLRGQSTPNAEETWANRVRGWVERGHNWSCPHFRLWPDIGSVDRESSLATISAPALVLHGDDDAMFPLPHGQAIATLLPNAELVVLPGRGHEILFDPDVARRAVRHVSGNTVTPPAEPAER